VGTPNADKILKLKKKYKDRQRKTADGIGKTLKETLQQ